MDGINTASLLLHVILLKSFSRMKPTNLFILVEECETPEHVREFLKDFKLKVNKDKENVEKKANQEADKLDTLPGFPSKQRYFFMYI